MGRVWCTGHRVQCLGCSVVVLVLLAPPATLKAKRVHLDAWCWLTCTRRAPVAAVNCKANNTAQTPGFCMHGVPSASVPPHTAPHPSLPQDDTRFRTMVAEQNKWVMWECEPAIWVLAVSGGP